MRLYCELFTAIALSGLGFVPIGEEVLRHDDGKQDSQRSMAGSAHAVLFERPEGNFYATSVRIFGSRYGGGYDPQLVVARVRLHDASSRVLAESFCAYSSWKAGAFDWVDVAIGPVSVPQAFQASVEFFPTQKLGVYLGVDADSEGHSFSVSEGSPPKALEGGDWMIRVAGSDKRPKVELPDLADVEVLARNAAEDGAFVDQRSTGGAGHAVRYKVSKRRILTGVTLYGARYGSRYSPERTFFNVFVCDKRLDVLAHFAAPYALFPSGELQWVDVALPPTLVPREFYVLVHFDPTQTKGVYLGRWKEKGGHSLSANPGKRGKKLDGGLGWMMRATLAASAGESSLPDPEPAPQSGIDAARLAELAAQMEVAEREEDVALLEELVAEVAEADPEAAAELGQFQVSAHFLLKRVGLSAAEGSSLLVLMESAHGALERRFGIERVTGIPGKRIHLHFVALENAETKLFTSPSSKPYSLIVYRGPRSSMRAPENGGAANVYGLCHELGHVLMGFKDDRHQWAHYIGSMLVEDVYAELGDEAWFEPYDARREGMQRFQREIEGTPPGRDSDEGVARLFYEIGEQLGTAAYGPALAWIGANREGEPFHAVRLYLLEDLRAALTAGGAEADFVRDVFGD